MAQTVSTSLDSWNAIARVFDPSLSAAQILESVLRLLLDLTGAVDSAAALATEQTGQTGQTGKTGQTVPCRAGPVVWLESKDDSAAGALSSGRGSRLACGSLLDALIADDSQPTVSAADQRTWGFRVCGPDGSRVGWVALAFADPGPAEACAVASSLCQMLGTAIAMHIARRRLEETVGALAERETVLREREMQCRLLLDQGGDTLLLENCAGLWDWNLATNAVDFSPTWKRQLGYADYEIPNTFSEWESRVHPDDLPIATERIEHLIRGRSSDYYAEFRMRHRDGSWRWIEARGVLRHNAADGTSRMIGTHFDVTEKKRAEEALWRQNNVLEQVAAGAPLAEALSEIVKLVEGQMAQTMCSILLLDGTGQRLVHGAAPSLPPEYVAAIDGVPVGPRVGSCGTAAYSAQTVVASDISSDDLWRDYRELALRHGLRACWSVPIVERRNGAPKGPLKRVLGTFAIYHSEPGAPSGYDLQVAAQAAHIAALAIQRDRTNRQMEDNKRFVERIVSASPSIIYVLDQKRHTTDFVNRRVAGDLGFGDAELPALHDPEFCRIMHPDDVPRFHLRIAALEAALDDAVVETEYRLRDVAGNWHWALARESVFTRGADGSVEKIVGSVQDVTARKLAEEQLGAGHAQLLHASRLTTMGQMVAALSHEVAQPLSAIRNFAAACCKVFEKADAAPDRSFDAAALREYVESIFQQSGRCGAILDRLRGFTRRTSPMRIRCVLEILVGDAVDLVAHELRGRNVKVDVRPNAELTQVEGDPVQLQQVVVNLLTNARDAVDHLPENERIIVIRTFEANHHVGFEVEDRGPGVTPDAALRLFDAFHTTKSDGMGMGLSICKAIVRDHGGTIAYATNSYGGSTFRVELPRVAAEPQS